MTSGLRQVFLGLGTSATHIPRTPRIEPRRSSSESLGCAAQGTELVLSRAPPFRPDRLRRRVLKYLPATPIRLSSRPIVHVSLGRRRPPALGRRVDCTSSGPRLPWPRRASGTGGASEEGPVGAHACERTMREGGSWALFPGSGGAAAPAAEGPPVSCGPDPTSPERSGVARDAREPRARVGSPGVSMPGHSRRRSGRPPLVLRFLAYANQARARRPPAASLRDSALQLRGSGPG